MRVHQTTYIYFSESILPRVDGAVLLKGSQLSSAMKETLSATLPTFPSLSHFLALKNIFVSI